MSYAIETGVPIPPKDKGVPFGGKERRKPNQGYPFADLEVGQSFYVRTADISDTIATRQSLTVSASKRTKSLGYRFIIRKVDPIGLRVWRVK